MEITILEFIPNEKKFKVGNVDFKVTYSSEKSETFRQASYFVKDKNKWISLPMVERNGKWVHQYERTPPMKDLMNAVVKALEEYLLRNPDGAITKTESVGGWDC